MKPQKNTLSMVYLHLIINHSSGVNFVYFESKGTWKFSSVNNSKQFQCTRLFESYNVQTL